uniref:Uncharacterized protein n=1 Tax=Populus davidiana TaxID=266767 RepID=A0A6M2EDG5_9ROSI
MSLTPWARKTSTYRGNKFLSQKKIIDTPIVKHPTATQGLKRSPILAAFQKKPRNPFLCSRIAGKCIFTNVHVQIPNSTTVRNEWKLNSADMSCFLFLKTLMASLPSNLKVTVQLPSKLAANFPNYGSSEKSLIRNREEPLFLLQFKAKRCCNGLSAAEISVR